MSTHKASLSKIVKITPSLNFKYTHQNHIMGIIFYFLQFILGVIIGLAIKVEKKLLLLGLAFPFSFGFLTVASFVFDIIGIPISLMTGIFALIMMSIALLVLKLKTIVASIATVNVSSLVKEIIFFIKNHWGVVFLIGVIIYLLYGISLKAVLWPSAAYDTIAGYDFVAKVISLENSLNNSIFSADHSLSSLRSSYPPLIPINFAYAYMAGFEYPKIVSVLILLSTALVSLNVLFSASKSWFAAILFTFILLSTPEYIAMSALSMTNVTTAFYAAFGLIFIYKYFDENKWVDFYIGVLLLFIGMWTRTEVIIFGLISLTLLMLNSNSPKNFKPAIILGILIIGSFIIWKFYVDNILKVETQQSIQFIPFYDSQKLADIARLVRAVTMSPQYYGWIVIMFFVSSFTLILKKRRKETLTLLLVIVTTWLAYVFLYYQMNNVDSNGRLVPNYITAGYRRGFFSFLPLIVFFLASTSFTTQFFGWINQKLRMSHISETSH